MHRYRRTPPRKVEALMKPGVPSVGPGDPLCGAAARMRRDRVGALLVMEDERLVGIVTERDLLGAMAEGLDPRTTPVSARMTASPRTVHPGETGAEAANAMIELGVRHLPVVREGRAVGVISARDLLQLQRRAPLELLGQEPW